MNRTHPHTRTAATRGAALLAGVSPRPSARSRRAVRGGAGRLRESPSTASSAWRSGT